MNETTISNPMEDIDTSPKTGFRRFLSWLWNPFNYTAGGIALIMGLVLIVGVSLVGGLSKTHFDGVLDTHTGIAVPMWFYVCEGIVNWLSLSVVLLVAGYILSGKKRFRAIDLFGTQALARWPFLFSALVALLPGYQRFSVAMLKLAKSGKFEMSKIPLADLPYVMVVTTVMLLATIWFVALAWKSFRISCDVKGGRAIAAFIIGILIAEVISKLAIVFGMQAIR